MTAGHPPLVLCDPSGVARELSGGREPLLGVGRVGPSRVAEVAFPPGSVLVAYTDGLVERRGEDIDVSIGRLVDACTGISDHTPSVVADELVERLLGPGDAPDDVALVVVRFEE